MPAPKGNTYALGNNGGRPPIYETPQELEEKINEYFDSLGENDKPTITGLCLYCGFACRDSFYDYQKNEEFSYAGA